MKMFSSVRSPYAPQKSLVGKTVCVTGAGGFIASHLLERLVREGANVRGLLHYNSRNDWGRAERIPADIRKSIRFTMGDILDPSQLRKALTGCDYVFHLAALISIPYSYDAPEMYVSINVQGTLNILETCRKIGIQRLVHTSTSEVYGTARYVPIDEKHPLQAQSPYSATKIGADKLVESYYNSFALPVVTVRPFNTYGPRQSARAIVPSIIAQALTRKMVAIGSTTPMRDLNYVEDTVDGFIRAAVTSKADGQVFNFGTGKDISIGDLAKKILALIGNDVTLTTDKQRIRPTKSEVMRLQCDSRKAAKILGWKPRHNLDEGLLNTIAWMRENIQHFKPTVYSK